MNENELINLLNQITTEVMRRVQQVQPQELSVPQAEPAQKPCTVVLVPSLVPFQDKAVKELVTAYGNSLLFVAFGDAFQVDRQRVIRADEESRDRILQLVSDSINVVCYRKEAVQDPNGNSRMLITEQDVLDAYHAGRRQIACRIDSIITPLARDKANELGVAFTSGEVF